jgi:hypothetical protein
LHITPITLSRLYGLLRMGSSIRRQGPIYIHFLLEVVLIVAADLPLVALMWLNQLSLRCHNGLFLVLGCTVIRIR